MEHFGFGEEQLLVLQFLLIILQLQVVAAQAAH
jgi:hypothetical protein